MEVEYEPTEPLTKQPVEVRDAQAFFANRTNAGGMQDPDSQKWSKIAAKMMLARLPVSMRTWHRIGLFVPGFMRDPAYAIDVFSFAEFLVLDERNRCGVGVELKRCKPLLPHAVGRHLLATEWRIEVDTGG